MTPILARAQDALPRSHPRAGTRHIHIPPKGIVRNIRHDILAKSDRDLKDKAIGEDEHARLQKQVQEEVNKTNAKIDEMLAAKETKIKTV